MNYLTHTTTTARALMLGVVLMASLATNSANAASIFLDTLLGGGSVVSGDLTFYDFVYSPNTNAPAPDLITVQAVPQGIKFAVPLLLVDQGVIDFDIIYKVTGAVSVESATLTSIGFGNNGGFTTVIQNINEGNTLLAAINNNFINGGGWNYDTTSLSATLPLTISTDVGLIGGGGTASLSDWTQTFNTAKASSPIPAPAAGLAGLALLGLIIAKRRWVDSL